MKLDHIDLQDLKVSSLNVRKHGQKNGEDLIASIQSVGLIQPLLVRANCEGFEVVAGQRRLNALQQMAREERDVPLEPIPCIIMEDGDDARAIEASLTENIARLPMDAIDQYEAFQALIKCGRSVDDIADHFGVTARLVKQRLAIANLYEPIRNAYRKDEVSASTLQLLTMATKRQQKDWYKMFKSEDEYAPEGFRLKNWLFGGEQIKTDAALFDLESYKGTIIGNLFEDERYFADPKTFWEHQSLAIATLMEEYREDGWQEVVLLDVGEHFPSWDYVDTPKEDGGKVYICAAANGEVTTYEGKLSRKEIERREKQECGEVEKPAKPELTKSMQNYLALHRHAAVRHELLNHPQLALRLCVAKIITGSPLWSVKADPQRANTDAITDSLETNTAQTQFAETRKRILAMLEINEDTDKPLVDHSSYDGRRLDLHEVFAALRKLDDDKVMEVLTYVVAETLESDSALVEGLGVLLNVQMSAYWQPDETFFALLRDKEAINEIVAEVGGQGTAKANITATAKLQKQIITDHLSGKRSPHMPDWQPRYMSFPLGSYTQRGRLKAAEDFKRIKEHYAA